MESLEFGMALLATAAEDQSDDQGSESLIKVNVTPIRAHVAVRWLMCIGWIVHETRFNIAGLSNQPGTIPR